MSRDYGSIQEVGSALAHAWMVRGHNIQDRQRFFFANLIMVRDCSARTLADLSLPKRADVEQLHQLCAPESSAPLRAAQG